MQDRLPVGVVRTAVAGTEGGGDGYEDDEEGVIEEVIPDMDDE